MRKLLLSSMGLAMLMLVGCVAPRVPRNTTFDASEYAWSTKPGTGVVTGQAFVTTLGGDVKYAAGKTVGLLPVTSYSTEWYERAVCRGEKLEDSPPEVATFTRRVSGDGQGNFKFKDVPAGEYYVGSYIGWLVPWAGYGSSGMSETGAWAHAKVTVREGQTTEVIATQ